MPFILEQSHSEIYSSAGGLAVVGPIINRHSGLKKRLKSVPLRHGRRYVLRFGRGDPGYLVLARC